MTLDEVPHWAMMAMFHKERWMQSGDNPHAPPMLVAEWDGRPIAVVICHDSDDAVISKAALMIVAGMDPDAIVLHCDTYGAVREPGEMADELHQSLRDGSMRLEHMARDGGLESGRVYEAMFVLRRDRAGALDGFNLPYRRDDHRVGWAIGDFAMTPRPEGKKPDLVEWAWATGQESYAGALEVMRVATKVPADQARIIAARAALTVIHQDDDYMVLPIDDRIGTLADFDPMAKPRKARPDPSKARRKKGR